MANITVNAPIFGKTLQEILLPLFFGAPTVAMGAAVFHTDFKRKLNLPIMQFNASAVRKADPDNCKFTPNDITNYTLTNRELPICKYIVNIEECKEKLLDLFDAQGIFSKNSPPIADYWSDPIMNAMLYMITNDMSTEIENLIWRGSLSTGYYDGDCQGFFQILRDAGTDILPAAQKISGVTLTAANIKTEMLKLWAALPAVVRSSWYSNPVKTELVFYVNSEILALFAEFYSEKPTGFTVDRYGFYPAPGENTYGAKWMFMGMPVFATPGLPPDTMILAPKSNMHVGLDVGSMETDAAYGFDRSGQFLNVIDMGASNGDATYRFNGAFRSGTQIAYPAYCVLYYQP